MDPFIHGDDPVAHLRTKIKYLQSVVRTEWHWVKLELPLLHIEDLVMLSVLWLVCFPYLS